VHATRPSPGEIRVAIHESLAQGRRRIEDVAQILCCSKSTLQRVLLAAEEPSFTEIRQEAQVRIALEHLTDGRPVWLAADRAAVSADHLRVIVKETTGLTPQQIVRAAEMSATLRRWRAQGPPRFGSWRYREQMQRWQKIDSQLQGLLADLEASHPLANWAKQVLVEAQRPDFRTQPYRSSRRREAERQAARIQRILEKPHSAPGGTQAPVDVMIGAG
jgi:methylphosphotriester-DNA--protein-cysteine methyltransferase